MLLFWVLFIALCFLISLSVGTLVHGFFWHMHKALFKFNLLEKLRFVLTQTADALEITQSGT